MNMDVFFCCDLVPVDLIDILHDYFIAAGASSN